MVDKIIWKEEFVNQLIEATKFKLCIKYYTIIGKQLIQSN